MYKSLEYDARMIKNGIDSNMWPFKPKKKGILLTGRIRNAFGDIINAPINVTILKETDIKYKIRIIGCWYIGYQILG